ncbi:hypothetical protein CNMCM6069_005964 [Aspergillus lentulus]|nr:hypothetical protein CNMCM6069_005964 [Aspergillus lentulus]
MSSRLPDRTGSKRSRSRSPSSWRQPQKYHRKYDERDRQRDGRKWEDGNNRSSQPPVRNMRDQVRLNQLQEDEQLREWVAQEDMFVLKQAKKKAEIRVKEGRAKPIDWLTVTLRVIDPTRNPLDDEIADSELDLVDPDGVFEGLSQSQLLDLEKDIDTFLSLEKNSQNRDFWKTMKVICRDRQKTTAPEGRALSSVAADINRLLSPKTYEQLETLEVQVRKKLDSNEPIDTDYWEELLRSLTVWKARAKVKKVYQAVIDERVRGLRKQQYEEAESIRTKLAPLAPIIQTYQERRQQLSEKEIRELDPEPLLQIRPEDKGSEISDEGAFLDQVARERQKILKMGFVPLRQRQTERPSAASASQTTNMSAATASTRFSSIPNEDFSQATKALYERELAKGVSENEEIFTGEESVSTGAQPQWASKYRPRKPRYFNRVQMGYEWNKYNQTHYDHDNPPPKVVQGYKFNIFYPDLIDKTKAPTYRIEREHGRKRGQSFAAAGEEDTCLIRFMAGPPYEDIAFRIVDKEWDYSAKRERGFKSTFDKVYPLSASTSPLEAPKDGNLYLFPYCDEGTSLAMAPYSRPDHAEIPLGYARATESSSDWVHGVEGDGRNGPDSQIYLTPSPAAEHFPQQSETMHTTPSPETRSATSSHVNRERTEVEREIERNDAEKNSLPDDSGPTDLPYSHLIAEALKTAPDRKRTLQEIYSWFEQNTSKGRDQRSKGWQNSIRHNLSMNAGFEAVRVESPNGKKAVNYWRLTDEAYRKGIQSTTRYRKQANHKRPLGSDPPAPQRQRSGAKGGKANKIAAKYRGQMFLTTGDQQDAAQRERLYLHPAPLQLQQQLPSQMVNRPPYLRAATSVATVSPTRASGPATLMHRPSAEQYNLGSVIGCTEAPSLYPYVL